MDRSNDTIKSFISLRSITKRYESQTVIDQASLDLPKGTFLSLLGPSGSGKTTILRMVAGLIQSDGGEIYLQGNKINHLPPHKRKMGMVFQQYALFPHMSVAENVAYGLKAQRMSQKLIKTRVAKYLEMVDLKHLAKRKPKELSGGQQQRVSLARALAVEPVVMLFDEPLSNLDVKLKEQMLREIRELHRSLGFTAIYVTHDQKEALYLSDQIAVLNQGEIEQLAPPEEILRSPATAFVADFFGYTNRLSPATYRGKKQANVGEQLIPISHVDEQVANGDQGVLLIRPNAIRIVDFQQIIQVRDHQETIPAEIMDVRYLGGEMELTLRLTGMDEEVIAYYPQMIYPVPESGTQVKVWIDGDGVSFFKESQKS